MERTGGVFIEQVIRPTGLIDPPVEIRPVEHQVDDLLAECKLVIQQGYRVLVTTLTKRMSEDLTEYMTEVGLKVRYLHSDIDRSEEHTSELQSLMRSSYAVFCLKKKKRHK